MRTKVDFKHVLLLLLAAGPSIVNSDDTNQGRAIWNINNGQFFTLMSNGVLVDFLGSRFPPPVATPLNPGSPYEVATHTSGAGEFYVRVYYGGIPPLKDRDNDHWVRKYQWPVPTAQNYILVNDYYVIFQGGNPVEWVPQDEWPVTGYIEVETTPEVTTTASTTQEETTQPVTTAEDALRVEGGGQASPTFLPEEIKAEAAVASKLDMSMGKSKEWWMIVLATAVLLCVIGEFVYATRKPALDNVIEFP